MKHLIVALDLEMNQPSGRIIQIGAVLGDMRSGALLSRVSVYANPLEPLAPEISKLCGIAPEVLDMAGSLEEAFEQMRVWLMPFGPERQLNPLTWGGGDSAQLRAQLGLNDENWLFGRRWIDVKTIFTGWQHAQGQEAVGGLATSMKKVGLRFQGRKHDAADDAANTFHMYFRLLSMVRRAQMPDPTDA